MLVKRSARSIAATFCAAVAACSLVAVAADQAASILLANFDFETTDAHAVWKEMSAKDVKPSAVSLDPDNPHSGKASLKFQTTTEGEKTRFVFTGINLPTDRTAKRIRVKLFARTAGIPAGEAEVCVLERDQTKVLGWADGKEKLIPIDAGAEWKEFSAEVPLRDETRVLTLFVRIEKPTESKTVWVDDLSIEFVEAQQ